MKIETDKVSCDFQLVVKSKRLSPYWKQTALLISHGLQTDKKHLLKRNHFHREIAFNFKTLIIKNLQKKKKGPNN